MSIKYRYFAPMPFRRLWLYSAWIAIFCLLFTVCSKGKEPVSATEQCGRAATVALAGNDGAHMVSARARFTSELYAVGRRQQIPAPTNERHTGMAGIPAFSVEWKVQRQDHTSSLNYDGGNIFVSRIRSLLYPKHSFW